MAVMKPVVVFLFNSPIESGCDYVSQTMRIVSRTHKVYGLALGDIVGLSRIFGTQRFVFRQKGSWVLKPISIVPGIRWEVVRVANYLIASAFLRLYLSIRFPGRPKILWYFEPFHIPPLLSIFRPYMKVYDCVDYYPGFHEAAKRQHITLLERSDYVFANSTALGKELARTRPDTTVVPVGFAQELFAHMRDSPPFFDKKTLVVGYIGSISDRIDFGFVHAVAKKLPYVTFRFIGSLEDGVFGKRDRARQSFEKLVQLKNVMWIPAVPKKDVPRILEEIDIGLIPYRSEASFNRLSFPMKVFEYFYAGKPVVSLPIEALAQFAREELLYIVQDDVRAVDIIMEIHRAGWTVAKMRKQRKHALKNTWREKISAIFRVLQMLPQQ